MPSAHILLALSEWLGEDSFLFNLRQCFSTVVGLFSPQGRHFGYCSWEGLLLALREEEPSKLFNLPEDFRTDSDPKVRRAKAETWHRRYGHEEQMRKD